MYPYVFTLLNTHTWYVTHAIIIDIWPIENNLWWMNGMLLNSIFLFFQIEIHSAKAQAWNSNKKALLWPTIDSVVIFSWVSSVFFYCNRKNFLFIFHPSRSKVGIYHHCHNSYYSSSNQRCSLDSWSLIFHFNHNNNDDNDDGERQEIIWSIDWLINQVMKISIWISCWFE